MIASAAQTATELTWNEQALWWGLALVGMICSAMFSGIETGVYRLNRVRLHLLAAHQRPQAVALRRLIEKPNRLISTLLIGNNIANYMATYAVAVLLTAVGLGDWQQIAVNAALLTPSLFVFGEVLPKDLFANYTDRILYPFARPLAVLQRLLMICGLLPLLDGLSHGLGALFGDRRLADRSFPPRRAMAQLIKEGLGRGVISHYQSAMIDRVLHPTEQKVAEAMIPWEQVHTLPADCAAEQVRQYAERIASARLPLVQADGSVLGALDVFDVLLAEKDASPAAMAHPLPTVEADLPIRAALRRLQLAQYPMGLVVRDGQPVGLVTFKDLVEPITGELAVW